MTTASRTWRMPTLPLGDWAFVTLIGWVGLLLISAAISIGIDRFNEVMEFFGQETAPVQVTESVWMVITTIAVWYTGFAGGFYMHQHLPAYVAHGRTRRDSMIEAFIFAGGIALLVTVLATVGFALEQGLYALADWTRGLPEDRLFDSYTAYGTIFLDTLLRNVVWAAAGMLVGAAFYRNNGHGWLAVVFVLLMASLTGLFQETPGPFMVVTRRLDIDPGLAGTVVLAAVATVVLGFVAWQSTRAVPLRNK